MKSAVSLVSGSDRSDGEEWRSYSPGSFTCSQKKLCLSRENHPSFHACRGNPVLRSHREREVPARCRGVAAEVLQHVPGGIASERYMAEIHKARGVGGKSLGNKGASVCSLCRNLHLPKGASGGNWQEGLPCWESQMLATSQHWVESGAGFVCQAPGTHKGAEFCLSQKCRDVAEPPSPSGRSGALASFCSWAKAQPR